MRSSCPISCALEVVGDTWSLLVVRDVLFRNRRKFSEIANEERIASNILTDRLLRLERAGLLQRIPDPKDRRRRVISPTEKAWLLAPLLLNLAQFGYEACGATDGKHANLYGMVKTNPEKVIDDIRSGSVVLG